MQQTPDGFDGWLATVPGDERSDPIWRMRSYRLARYAGSIASRDVDAVRRSPVGFGVADQLLRAIHSIAANLAEGYSRGSGTDRVRFYEYALGSTREATVWYAAATVAISASDLDARHALLAEIRRLLLATIKSDRHRRITSAPP